jgi:hypothetical protein
VSGKHGRRRVVALPTATPAAPSDGEAPRGRRAERHADRGQPRHAGATSADAISKLLALSESGHGSGRTATLDRPAHEPEPQGPATSSVTATATRAAPGVDLILPGGRGIRRAAREEKRQQQRKRALVGAAAAVVIGLIVWAVGGGGSSAHHGAQVGPDGRTQTTVLLQLKGTLGEAVDSALLAHDTAEKSGAVVLVPSAVIAQVPGFGPMPFGQALTLNQPNATRATLSDLMGVSVDASWVLTQKGMAALVDKVGGVTVTVDRDVTKPGPNGTTTIVVAAGDQKLNGAAAVAYASFLASGETEQLRLARFDAVLSAVLAQLPKQPAEIGALITGLGTGSTSSVATTRLADVLAGLAADTAANSTYDTVLPVTRLDTGDDQNAFSLDTAKTQALVQQQFAQSIPLSRKGTGNRVMIENQVGTPGIGETTRAKLVNAGFVYLPGQNAPGMPNATAPSVVLISGTSAADIAKGNAVAKALGLPTSDVRVSQQSVRVADVIVLLGADYKP